MKYIFTVSHTSVVTITLSTEEAPPNFTRNSLDMQLICADKEISLTATVATGGMYRSGISSSKWENTLSKDYSYKIYSGTYYLRNEVPYRDFYGSIT